MMNVFFVDNMCTKKMQIIPKNAILQCNDYVLNHRHGRTYGPLLGLFLASLLTKALAKYAAASFLPITYPPWILQNHKLVNYIPYDHVQQPNNAWQPASPFLHGLTAFAADYHHESYSPTEYYPQLDTHDPHTATEFNQKPPNEHIHQEETHDYQAVPTAIESPHVFDQITSQSQVNYRRQRPPNRWNNHNYLPRRDYQNRIPYDSVRNRNPVNRYRPTTPYYDYNYESYDEPTTRYTPYRTRRPTYRRKPVGSFEYSYENSEYDDSYYDDIHTERTTKPYKRRKKPTKKNRFKKRKDASEEDLDDSESVEVSEENYSREKEVKVKQRQQQSTTTTESTESTGSSTSTTETTTETTTSTSNSSQNQNTSATPGYGTGGGYDNISFTYGPPVFSQQYGPPKNEHHYGYGPSNGNEAVSLTYSPPLFPIFQHNYPYSHWIPQEATKNAIIRKVHDIVGYDDDFVHRAK
ncbi:hypothetical protein WA026_008698 [Henosepilachna vigintioctopunctata]|uniref:Uncharacterized protein n=1 Tax=Henosepilachna vigintioctopunctata TaxID=420089 RepID=A0AAW1VCY7_9CUCU